MVDPKMVCGLRMGVPYGVTRVFRVPVDRIAGDGRCRDGGSPSEERGGGEEVELCIAILDGGWRVLYTR